MSSEVILKCFLTIISFVKKNGVFVKKNVLFRIYILSLHFVEKHKYLKLKRWYID
jgi:hypothetical protein